MVEAKRIRIEARWIAPVAPQNLALEGHSLVLEGERILALGLSDEMQAAYPEAEALRLPSHLLTPGLVNAHTHAAMTLVRGFADDLPMMTWLKDAIWPLESRLASPEFVYDGTRLAALEMLSGGVTCAADSYYFPDASSRAFVEMKMRAQIGLMVIDSSNAWARDEEEHIHKALQTHDDLKHQTLLTTALAPHAPYSVTDKGFERVQTYAGELDVPVHLHLHETAEEVADAVKETGERPLARMQRLGLVSPSLQAVHATQLEEAEIALLAEAGAHIAHCPESNCKLASGVCPVPALLAAGVNVALGTDGAASNNDLDLLQEARTAAFLAKAGAGDATCLPAYQALELLTLGGARLLGLDGEIGSLEPGKKADLAATDLGGFRFLPVYDPVSQYIYAANGTDASHVWVDGRLLLEDGRLNHADTGEIVAKAGEWRQKTLAAGKKGSGK